MWVNVLPLSELNDLLEFQNPYFLKNAFHDLMILRKEEQIYAMKSKCPHQGKSLEGCWVDGNKVVCPVHQFAFSLENGRGHGLYLDRFDTRINDGWLQIKKERWSFFGLLV